MNKLVRQELAGTPEGEPTAGTKAEKEWQNDQYPGGMRHPRKAVAEMPLWQECAG